MEALQGRVSGIALPKLIVDTPGGRGKVPLAPDYVVGREGAVTRLRTFRGEIVEYVDPPCPRDGGDGDTTAAAHDADPRGEAAASSARGT